MYPFFFTEQSFFFQVEIPTIFADALNCVFVLLNHVIYFGSCNTRKNNQSSAVQFKLTLQQRSLTDDWAWLRFFLLLFIFCVFCMLLIKLFFEWLAQFNKSLRIFSLFEANESRTFVRVLGLALELGNFHVAGSFTKHRIGNLPELFHVFFEGLLTYVPCDVPHKKRRIVGSIGSLFRFFKLFLRLNHRCLHYLFLFFFWFFLFFKFDRLWTDNFLLSLISIIEYVLHLSFVGSLWQTELNSEITSFELFAIHSFDCTLSVSFVCEFYESKAPVLVVCVVEWHVNAIDFAELFEGLFEMLLTHVEHQVSHDNAALSRRRWTVPLLGLFLFGFGYCRLWSDLWH